MKQLDRYTFTNNDIEYTVTITDNDDTINEYGINVIEFKESTLAVLEQIKEKLAQHLEFDPSTTTDENYEEEKQQCILTIRQLVTDMLPPLDKKTETEIIAHLFNEMYGLGHIEVLLSDEHLEEILINSTKEPIYVYHRAYKWLKTNIRIYSEETIRNYSAIIARRVKKQITELNPILDAQLQSGDRSNILLPSISSKGHSISIRKFTKDTWTVTDFIKNKTCSKEVFAIIWLAIQYEMNILFSGGTASGKTSFLNIFLPLFPVNQRIITIEDTKELRLPNQLLWTPLITKQPNIEGKGKISMHDLMVASLRMRPDRIILGEVRTSEDANVALEAMHTGHSVYSTLHANDMNSTISRLINPPMSLPENLLQMIDLNVVLFRNRRTGVRRVYEMGEFLYSSKETGSKLTPNILYKWNAKTDEIEEYSSSMRLINQISMHTGLSQKEIYQEIQNRITIVEYLVAHNIRDINSINQLANMYYSSPDTVLKKIKKNSKVEELLNE